MNKYLLDPKFIMLAGVVILVIAVVAWLCVQKRRSTTGGPATKVWPRVRASGAEAGVRTKSTSEPSESPKAS
jgi:hypothetical protein